MQELVVSTSQGAFGVVFFAPSWVLDLALLLSWFSVLLPVAGAAAVGAGLVFVSRERRRRQRFGRILAYEQSARQEAEEALYSMAHDLKTPLVTLDHLVEEIDGAHRHCGEDFHEAAEDTRQVLRHMGGLVDQMLSFAHGVSGSATEGRVRVDKAVDEVADMLRSECEKRQVRLRVEGGPETVLHMAPEALRHVLLNLMDNAVKYGPDKEPVVRVSWAKTGWGKGASFVLEVADNGDGIPVDNRERVFRLLQRFPDRRGRDLPGSGVGLAVVRRVVHQQGARVEIDDAPEGGALFRVVFPSGHWEGTEGNEESSGSDSAAQGQSPRAVERPSFVPASAAARPGTGR